MAESSSVDRLIEVCRAHIAESRRAVALMQAGQMGTTGIRHGQMTDTTKETIHDRLMSLLDMESAIAMIEHDRKLRPQ